jgi:hypothetical protein
MQATNLAPSEWAIANSKSNYLKIRKIPKGRDGRGRCTRWHGPRLVYSRVLLRAPRVMANSRQRSLGQSSRSRSRSISTGRPRRFSSSTCSAISGARRLRRNAGQRCLAACPAVKPIASVLGAAREMEMLVLHTRMKWRSTSPTSRCRRRILAGVRQPHPTVWMSPLPGLCVLSL